MKSGDFKGAAQDLDGLLAEKPKLIDALYMRAACDRYLSNYEGALKYLNDLKNIKPDYGRAYQEEGHVYRAIGRSDQALIAYQRACSFNPVS